MDFLLLRSPLMMDGSASVLGLVAENGHEPTSNMNTSGCASGLTSRPLSRIDLHANYCYDYVENK